MRLLPLLALIPAAAVFSTPVTLTDRADDLERRVIALERKWAEHHQTYHFTCSYEDCLTVDEMLRPEPQFDERQQWLEDAFPFNKPNRCRGLCGGQAWWTGYECICPDGDPGEEK